ncbi:MAG: NB-ARC domain-containing protein, partial [Xenococcus sp. (in: cyanobacteria)]
MAEEPKVRQDINQADVATGNVEGNQYIYSSRPFPLGIPFQAPPLPSHFVDRPEVSQDLKQRLLADSTTHSGTLVISAIQGLGGIGKTILAQALAHDSQVQERFCDGILWATLGQQPDILSLLQGWIVALKDYDYKPTTVKAASSHLNSLLYDKAVLLVIDDGWNVEDIEPFRVGSGNCQVIITTRLVDVAKKYDAQSCQLKLMSEEQSLALLVKRLGRELDDTEQKLAKQLAEAVEYLPLALDLVAARIAEGETWQELYSALTAEINRLKALEAEDDEFIVVKSESKKESVEACFNVSLNFLQNKYSSKIWSSLVWLGVLPEDLNIAAPMVATLWEVEVTKAAKILKILWNNALLLPGVPVRIGTEEWATYRIHDLLHDLAIRW